LSQNLISIEAKYKFRLCSDSVVLYNFRRDIAVDLDDLKGTVLGSELFEVLISDFALWVPGRSEIDDSVVGFIFEKVGIEFL
jgi:hypothetical protein